MFKKIPFKRLTIYLLGLMLCAVGNMLQVNAELGVGSMASLPYVISKATPLTLGTLNSLLFASFVLMQILFLRKNFKWRNCLSLIFAFLFGLMVDLVMWIFGDWQIPTYFGQFFMLMLSIGLISMGIVLFLSARIIDMPPEGLCRAISEKYPNHKVFGKLHLVKMIVDSSVVLVAIPLSLIFFGSIEGIREGTVLTALLIGRTMPYAEKLIEKAKHIFQNIRRTKSV